MGFGQTPPPWLGQNPKFVKGNIFAAPLSHKSNIELIKIRFNHFVNISMTGELIMMPFNIFVNISVNYIENNINIEKSMMI